MINLQDELLNRLKEQLNPDGRYLVAISGGIDSIVLLHLVSCLRQSNHIRSLRAAHINHQLCNDANRWEDFCVDYCAELATPCLVEKITINKTGNLEARARKERYKALATLLQEDETLLIAHHASDYLETFFINLLRGTGSQAAMMQVDRTLVDNKKLLRPLLHIQKSDIVAYAHKHGLTWCEDASNENLRFTRNFVRHKLLAPIAERNAGTKRLFASVSLLENQLTLLKDYARAELTSIKTNTGELKVKELASLPVNKQQLMLSTWLQDAGVLVRSSKQIQEIMRLTSCKSDRSPMIRCTRLRHSLPEFMNVRFFRGLLYLVAERIVDKQTISLSGEVGCLELEHGILSIEHGGDIALPEQLKLAFRVGGERLLLNGQHKLLKKLWQSWGIPPWQRVDWPILYAGGEIVCIPNYAYADNIVRSSCGVKVVWRPH